MLLAIALAIALAAAVLLACVLTAVRDASWDEERAPISDAEFLARCSPGVNPETALTVRRLVSEHLGIPYERVHPEQRFDAF